MSFLGAAYFCFFPIAAIVYFLLPGREGRVWLLVCSWAFCLCSGALSLAVLLCVSVVTYFAALYLGRRPGRGTLAAVTVLLIGVLVLFKYLAPGVGGLPAAGISFYILAALGYLVDVYRGRTPAERSFVRCALFLSFFPSLLSGPIGRAERLLPQLGEKHGFDYDNLRRGLLRFLWGAFKKLVIADRLAPVADTVFASPESFGAVQVAAAALVYSVQIYCDFSAYSDMALGSARILGFTLTENFQTPFFSRTVAEFWRRWHVSLSSWLRDYIYIPLGGSRKGKLRKWLNVLAVFAVSGLWHGASPSFLVWGLLSGLYQVLGALTAPLRSKLRSALRLRDDGWVTAVWQSLCVFLLFAVSMVIFKTDSLTRAWTVFQNMAKPELWSAGGLAAMGIGRKEWLVAGLGSLLLFAVDAASQSSDVGERVLSAPRWVRWCVYLGLLMAVVIFGSYGTGYNAQDFIYGQF